MRRLRAVALASVFMFSATALGWRLGRAGIGAGYLDPVGGIRAQDESVYTHTALRMAHSGGWLTPRFLDRLALYKPPMTYWLSGASARLSGSSRVSVRLPSLLAGAAVATLCFAWVWGCWGISPACAALLLFLSNPLVHRLSRLNLTDMLLLFWMMAALTVLGRDPALERRPAAGAFGVFAGLAILTKGIAGLLPLLAAALYWVAAPGGARPAWKRLALAVASAAAVALPWHLYQLLANSQWFWAEYVRDEILFWGAGRPPQTSAEPHAWFYLRRLAVLDPVLLTAFAVSLPGFASAVRKGDSGARILAAWLVAAGASVLAFQYRNAAYLLPLAPAMAIVAAAWNPLPRPRAVRAAVLALAAAAAVKASLPFQPWGLPYGRGMTNPAGQALRDLCLQNRNAELILVEPDDEFVSAVLPFPRVRYCYLQPEYRDQRSLDFRALKIVAGADEFAAGRPDGDPALARLQAWNGNRLPYATTILAASAGEVARLIQASPHADFYLPEEFKPLAAEAARTHFALRAGPGRFFLLSSSARPRPGPAPALCRLTE